MTSSPDLLISFAAGLLSFISPCVLPLIPSFISYVGGVSLAELSGTNPPRRRIMVRTGFFVAGFSLVFVVLGVVFSSSGILLSGVSRTISLVAGLIVIVLGFNLVFDFLRFLNMEKRLHLGGTPSGYAGAFVIGMAFGGGWTPCIGPILAGILFMAGQSGQILLGALYLLVYSFGLGLPFILASIFFVPFMKQASRLRKYLGVIRISSGIFLIGIGLLIALDRFQQLNIAFISFGYALQEWTSAYPLASRRILGFAMILIGSLPLVPPIIRIIRTHRRSEGRTGGDGVGRVGTVESRRTRILSVPKILFFAVFSIIGILQFAGVIDTGSLISSWLVFQGI